MQVSHSYRIKPCAACSELSPKRRLQHCKSWTAEDTVTENNIVPGAQRSWTGVRPSGTPRAAVMKMAATLLTETLSYCELVMVNLKNLQRYALVLVFSDLSSVRVRSSSSAFKSSPPTVASRHYPFKVSDSWGRHASRTRVSAFLFFTDQYT